MQTRRGSELVVDHPQAGATLIEAIESAFDAHRARPTLSAPAHIEHARLLARQKAPASGSVTDGPVEVAVERGAPLGQLTECARTTGHLTEGDLIGDAEQQDLQRVTGGPLEGHRADGGLNMKSLEDLVDPLAALALAWLIDRLWRLAQPPAVLGEKAKRAVEQSLDRADRQALGQPGQAWCWPLRRHCLDPPRLTGQHDSIAHRPLGGDRLEALDQGARPGAIARIGATADC